MARLDMKAGAARPGNSARPAKSRLVQLLERHRSELGLTQAQMGAALGASQQAYNTWIGGVVPRPQFHARIARLLGLTPDQMHELITEISEDALVYTKAHGAGLLGIGDQDGIEFFDKPRGYIKPDYSGCYAINISGKTWWVSPDRKPLKGNTVIVRRGDTGRIAKWPDEIDGDEAVHVVVLVEP